MRTSASSAGASTAAPTPLEPSPVAATPGSASALTAAPALTWTSAPWAPAAPSTASTPSAPSAAAAAPALHWALTGTSATMWTSARRGSRASTAARISQGALAASAPLATLRRGGCAGTGMSALRAPTTAGGPRAASTLLGGTSVSPASSAGDPTHLTPAATGPACAPRVSPAAPPAPVGSSIVSWPFPKFPMFPLGFSSSSTPRGTPKGCGCGEAPLAPFACGR